MAAVFTRVPFPVSRPDQSRIVTDMTADASYPAGGLVYEEKPRPGEELPAFAERLLGKRRWRRLETPSPPA
jgi:hypothetical protein